MRRLPVALLTIGLAGGLVACGTSGRDLRVPQDGAVSPTRSVSTVATVPTTPAPIVITLIAPGMPNGGPIPPEYSCDGVSPALTWTGVTASVKELALVVVDNDAEGYVHWLVTGIKASNASIPKGQLPPGAVQHTNSGGVDGWSGPCPPVGQTHTYTFYLLGLDAPSALAPGLSPTDAIAALQTASRGNQAVLTGTFAGGTAVPGSGVPGAGGTTPGSALVPPTAAGASSSTTTTAKATTTAP